ncbi:hypothetical protein niasHT_031793 [Heterodera trifolii]|uniref:F-box protein n=1 Tax=Heterodera trifolii TaxID=157864 RepID=A0ABD2IH97_9BILA
MSDTRKEAEEKMAKAIFLSADCWLGVFHLLPPSQLGLGIALISHRFDLFVDEHFKTRKWALKCIRIRRKIGENGTKEMQIVNFRGDPYFRKKLLPIPQMQLSRKVTGFKRIFISFIDQNAIAFLRRFRSLFAACPINVAIQTINNRCLELIWHNIWPMLRMNIHGMELVMKSFHRLRKFAPSLLNDCPSLRFVFFNFEKLFTEFPPDDSAMASDGQAMTKWLLTPRPDNVPKVFSCGLNNDDGNWSSRLEAFKAAFASASSPANFIVVISFRLFYVDSVVPFDETNEFTREQLTLKRTDKYQRFLLVRCPIVRDADKWAKWEEEAIGWRIDDQWNKIDIQIDNVRQIGDGLLGATPGPSDQLK